MSTWQQRPSISRYISENALNRWMSSAVTLILDISMMQPSEAMVKVKAVIKRILIALLIPGGMMGLETKLALAAVVLNTKLSFCHKCGSESRSAVESIVASMSGWCVLS